MKTAAAFLAASALAAVSAFAERDCGLVLLKAVDSAGNPVACTVTLDGRSLGTTPVFVSSLPTNRVYRIVYTANGWQDAGFDLQIPDRRPIVRTEKMKLDSGSVAFSTEPEGAEVSVNGTPRGKSPLTVPGIPKGVATVRFSMPGYKTEEREMSVAAGEETSVSIVLKPLPASLRVVSSPEGARVYVDGEYCGVAPLDLPGLDGGTHSIRAEMENFAAQSRTVELEAGRSRTEEFRLSTVLASVAVSTIPGGAEVLMDGKRAGETKDEGRDRPSKPLKIDNLRCDRKYRIEVRCYGYADRMIEMKPGHLKPGETFPLNVRLKKVFTPDFFVIDRHAAKTEGELVSRTPEAVVLRTRPGVEKIFLARDISSSGELAPPKR